MTEQTNLPAIQGKIHTLRDRQVMLDFDLAKLYGVETKHLKQAVKRNANRFPPDFMFALTPDEVKNLRSQIATSRWGGSRKLPFAFTEQGVAMLSSVLNSDITIRTHHQQGETLEINREGQHLTSATLHSVGQGPTISSVGQRPTSAADNACRPKAYHPSGDARPTALIFFVRPNVGRCPTLLIQRISALVAGHQRTVSTDFRQALRSKVATLENGGRGQHAKQKNGQYKFRVTRGLGVRHFRRAHFLVTCNLKLVTLKGRT